MDFGAIFDNAGDVVIISIKSCTRQISGETVGEVRIVSDMHERKADMAREAEAFIALPGIKRKLCFVLILSFVLAEQRIPFA